MRNAALVLLCASLVWAGQKPSETLFITNVNLVDIRNGGIVPNLTVVIKDGIVDSFGKIALIDSRAGVRVVNGGGKYLIPALWDMNAQLSSRNPSWSNSTLYALYLSSGVMGLRELSADGERLRPVTELLNGPARQKQLVSVSKNSPASRRTIESIEEVMLACSSREHDLRGRKPEPPQEDIEYAFEPKLPLQQEVRESYAPAKAHDFFLKVADRGMWMVPGLVSLEAPIASFSKDDWEEISDPTSIKRPRSQVRAILEAKAEFSRALLLVHDMRGAGVQFLAGTGAPRENVTPGQSLHRELELLAKSGFSALDALRAATFNPALYLAKLDQYGVVEPGHVADLVLLDENPLQDIQNIEKVNAVIVEGKYFSRAELDALAARSKSGQAATGSTAPVTTNKVPH